MSNTGTVKCFNAMNNFGFITASDGTELFVHSSNCKGGLPQEGETVTFDIEECPKKPGQNQATNVVGGTGAQKGVMGSGSCQATVKSFNAMKGWGFITYEGADVFVHIRDMALAQHCESQRKSECFSALQRVSGGVSRCVAV